MSLLKLINNILAIFATQRRYAQMLQKMSEGEEDAQRFLLEQRGSMSARDWQMFASTLLAWRSLAMKAGDFAKVRFYGWLVEVAERLE
ncbi:MAG: hypothetical protein DYG89_01085 [Caldilinea sp. CFX5]|nr:hypothetical protein [Caldilinea sp. CFX5]